MRRLPWLLGLVAIFLVLFIIGRKNAAKPPQDDCLYGAGVPPSALLVAIADVSAEAVVNSGSAGVAAGKYTLVSTTIPFSVSFKKGKNKGVLLVSNSGGIKAGLTGRNGLFCILALGRLTYLEGPQVRLKLYHVP